MKPFEVGGREVDVGGGGVLFQPGSPLGAGDGCDVLPLGQQPRQGELPGCELPHVPTAQRLDRQDELGASEGTGVEAGARRGVVVVGVLREESGTGLERDV